MDMRCKDTRICKDNKEKNDEVMITKSVVMKIRNQSF